MPSALMETIFLAYSRYVPVFEKKSEIPISLGSRERALRAERFKLKSEFGPFLTYVTWSKMSHVLPMFETLPWFSSDLGLKPQVIPMVPKALHVLSTTCRSDPILHHAPPISFCCTNTGPRNVSRLEGFAQVPTGTKWNGLPLTVPATSSDFASTLFSRGCFL